MRNSPLSVQLHDVGHFIPAKPNKPLVIAQHVLAYNHVGFKVLLPVHLQGRETWDKQKHLRGEILSRYIWSSNCQFTC